MLKTLRQHETKEVVASATSSLRVPAFGKIHNIYLHFLNGAANATKSAIEAAVDRVRLSIDGKDIVNCTAAQLFAVYERLGTKLGNSSLDNGVMELNLGRLIFDMGQSKDVFGFGTFNVATIQVQITYKATTTGVTSCQLYTSREAVQNAALGTYPKLYEYPQTYGSTGEHTVDTLPRDINTDYLAIFCDQGASGTGVVSFGELSVNSQNVFDRTPTSVMGTFNNERKMVQPTGLFDYMLTNGTTNDRLPMNGVKDLRLKTTFSTTPDNYSLLALTLENVPRGETK